MHIFPLRVILYPQFVDNMWKTPCFVPMPFGAIRKFSQRTSPKPDAAGLSMQVIHISTFHCGNVFLSTWRCGLGRFELFSDLG